MLRGGRLPRIMFRQTGMGGVPVVGWDRRVAAVRLGVRLPLVTRLVMVVLSPLVTSRRCDGASVQQRPGDEGDDQAGGRDEATHPVDRGQPEAAVDGLAAQDRGAAHRGVLAALHVRRTPTFVHAGGNRGDVRRLLDGHRAGCRPDRVRVPDAPGRHHALARRRAAPRGPTTPAHRGERARAAVAGDRDDHPAGTCSSWSTPPACPPRAVGPPDLISDPSLIHRVPISRCGAGRWRPGQRRGGGCPGGSPGHGRARSRRSPGSSWPTTRTAAPGIGVAAPR